MIYLIGNRENDICKIGFSNNPLERIKAIESQVPFNLEILSITEGNIRQERLFHSFNDEARIKGEWYILSKIKNLNIEKYSGFINIGQLNIMYDADSGYIHIPSLVSDINLLRANKTQFSTWVKQNSDFLNSFDNHDLGRPILKKYCSWIHPFVAIEFIISTLPNMRMVVYENIALFNPLYDLIKSRAS